MVDPDRARRLLESLARYAGELADLRDAGREVYLAEPYRGRYLVQICAQVSIDLTNHVIASEGWRTPADFADLFTVLAENDVVDSALAERLRRLAGLRNRLVHVYVEVDDSIVFDALGPGLDDFDELARAISRLVAQQA